eukprot:6214326-Pleurochrysis_carterae.AAC.3
MFVDLKGSALRIDEGQVEYVRRGCLLVRRGGQRIELVPKEALLIFLFLEGKNKCVFTTEDVMGKKWEAQVCHHAGRFMLHVGDESHELIFTDRRLRKHARKQARDLDPSHTAVSYDFLTQQVEKQLLEQVSNDVHLKHEDVSREDVLFLTDGQARLVTRFLEDGRSVCTFTERDENGEPWHAEACKHGTRYVLHEPKASYDLIVPQSIEDRVLKECMTRAHHLYSVYEAKYVFPTWVKNDFMAVMKNLGSRTKVYFSERQVENVRSLVTLREPVNITRGSDASGNLGYDTGMMMEHFKYAMGSYEHTSPNFAIYCETPVTTSPLKNEDVPYAQHLQDVKHLPRVKVINVVVYVFDSTHQPDYDTFNVDELFITDLSFVYRRNTFINNLVKRYTEVWVRVLHAAHDHNCTRVNPAINKAKDICKLRGIDVVVDEVPFDSIPTALEDYDLDTCLFTNAWDPWSIIGNGNRADDSSNGRWGRQSAMSVLCWPITNPWMRGTDAWRYVDALRAGAGDSSRRMHGIGSSASRSSVMQKEHVDCIFTEARMQWMR